MAFISNGTTMLDAGAFSVSLGSMIHIKTITASSSSTIQFQDGSSGVTLDNTYPLYLFKIINMHPSVDNHIFEFQANATEDHGQSTDHQHLANGVGNSGGSRGLSGELFLYNPSNTTFVKHFMARCQFYEASDASVEHYTSGYFNTTSAIDEIQFRMASGNIDDGTFKLYGIKDS